MVWSGACGASRVAICGGAIWWADSRGEGAGPRSEAERLDGYAEYSFRSLLFGRIQMLVRSRGTVMQTLPAPYPVEEAVVSFQYPFSPPEGAPPLDGRSGRIVGGRVTSGGDTLDEDSPNTGVSLGLPVVGSDESFAHQVVTFSGAGAQTAVLEVAADLDDLSQELNEEIAISLASNAEFDGPAHGSATNVGGGADPHTTGSPPQTDRFG